jgi:hypothetical protein
MRDQELLDTVQAGIERDRARRQQARVVAELQERFMSLASRFGSLSPSAKTKRLHTSST